ncbi:39S ribosomal protein L46, mitochondrial-like [Homarus americanus]|uniref:39S ribosomal protein L46, mitochondrial-like n=1 Tax=Homarus americanus TaxID=6706 RepID=UPI001C491080|nr:39S ribosomal protein L46, mitochondrial-like [Homarus americanus]
MAVLQTMGYFTRYFRQTLTFLRTRSQSSLSTVGATGRWQIVGAACITRQPVVCPPLTPIEQQYSEMLATVEKNLSLKSDHELRHEQDLIRTQFLKSGDAEDIDLEDAAKQTAVEFADACEEELRTFKASLPEPGTDDTNDLSSLSRSLERSLVLVVKQKLGTNHEWVLPQTPWVPGETLRQTCERVVRESCGDDLQVKFLGNAPCGFYKYKYPKNVHQEEFIGAKVFFFKGQVRDTSGSVQLGEDIAEHQWLTQDELDDKFKQSYAKSVSQFLVSDQ